MCDGFGMGDGAGVGDGVRMGVGVGVRGGDGVRVGDGVRGGGGIRMGAGTAIPLRGATIPVVSLGVEVGLGDGVVITLGPMVAGGLPAPERLGVGDDVTAPSPPEHAMAASMSAIKPHIAIHFFIRTPYSPAAGSIPLHLPSVQFLALAFYLASIVAQGSACPALLPSAGWSPGRMAMTS